MIRCLGVDLGLVGGAGLAVLEDGSPPHVLATLALPPRQSAQGFLDAVADLLLAHQPYLVICERPWTGRRDPRPNVGLAQRERLGLVKLACEQYGLPKSRLRPIYAVTMKRMITGSGKAGKREVGSIVRSILGVEEENEHVLDSLGLALCGLQAERVKRKDSAIRKEMAARAEGKCDW